MAKFDDHIGLLLELEGGYVNDQRDPGGETKYGISKRAFPDLDIKGLTKKDASELYKERYWDAMKLDSLEDGLLAGMIFDFGVNAGPSQSARALQRAHNTLMGAKARELVVDGRIGPVTLGAVNSVSSSYLPGLRAMFDYERMSHYVRLGGYALRGWMNRVWRTNRG